MFPVCLLLALEAVSEIIHNLSNELITNLHVFRCGYVWWCCFGKSPGSVEVICGIVSKSQDPVIISRSTLRAVMLINGDSRKSTPGRHRVFQWWFSLLLLLAPLHIFHFPSTNPLGPWDSLTLHRAPPYPIPFRRIPEMLFYRRN